MYFVSTGGGERVTGAEAIVKGFAKDGGLFVPETFPQMGVEDFEALLSMDYPERAAFILKKFFDEYDEEGLLAALREAYAKFEGDDPVPLVRMDNGMYLLELFHGPTCSYKDVSLTVLPYLVQKGCEILGVKEKLLLLTATNGDTGKAALESFRDLKDVKIMVVYPEDGCSKMQKLQLCTQEGENLNVLAVRGSFDDCQAAVKKIFTSDKCQSAVAEKGLRLGTVSSANFGRIALQICYYFSAYLDLVSSDQVAQGDKVNICIPAGNFGNVIAAYYAKRMGLPVAKLLCASNKNNVLTEFFKTGNYDAKRNLYRTMSPAMDLLVCTNVERLIFELSGRDAALTAERMASLASTGKYALRADELKKLKSEFAAAHTSEDDTVDCMYEFFMEYGYPMDTHTGVAMSVAERYEEKKKDDPMSEKYPMIVVSTASPYKFPQDVLYALTGNDVKDSFKGVKRINLLTAMKVPEPIKAVRYKPILFKTTVAPDKIFDEVLKFIG